jgi:hypothetical protein
MKKIIIIILLTFCVSNVFAQQYTPMTAAGYQMKRLKVDSTLHIPSFCGVPTTRNSTAKEGAIAMDTCNNLLYTWTNSSGWTSISGGTIVDTAAINAAIALRVKYTDTLLMLQPYLRKVDTTNRWVNSVTKINDSTIRVIKNTLTTDLLIRGSGVKYSDTATMLSKYLRKVDTASLSNRINLKVNISDTATMLSKYLRKIDTASLSNRINLKLNISDTATMLSKYLRKIDTTAMLLPYLRKIDTTAMLSKYLRRTDTTAMLLPYLRKVDTTNKFVNNVTKVNDSTIRIFKGSTSTDLLIRGNASGGGTNTLQDVLTAGNNASNINNFNFTLAELQDGGDGQKIFNAYNLDKQWVKAEMYIGPSEPYLNFGWTGAPADVGTNSVEIKPSGILFNSESYANYHLNVKGIYHSENYELIFPLPQNLVGEIDTLATLRNLRDTAAAIRSSGGGTAIDTTNRFVNSVTSVNDSTIRIFKGSTSSTITIKGSTTGFVPYTGATTNLDMGTKNVSANAYFNGFTSMVAAGTTVTLTVDSTPVHLVTGSGGQTFKLPVATTLTNGTIFSFNNNQSSGTISVNNNSNTLVKSVPSGAYLTLELTDNTTATGTWDAHFQTPSNVSWSTNTFDYGGSITSAQWNGTTVAYNRGGTGQSSLFTQGGVAFGSTTTALATTAAGTSGQMLVSAGTGTPTWADTSVFQRKNIAAYSLQANNTASAANVTTQTYRDVAEAAISGTITWTSGTAPTTLTSANYQWQQIGKVVTVQVSLLYTNPSAAITAFYFPLPSDMPLPVTPTGWSAASNYLFTGSGTTHTTVTTLGTIVFASFIRRDAANTGYEIGGGGAASSARGYKLNLTYKAQ